MNPGARAHVALGDLIPLRYQARGFSLLPRQPVRSLLTGRHASRLRGRGLDFEELRRYVQGDDVRTIDWFATARRRSPHVRVYTEERDRSTLLVVDQRQSMFFGSRRAMKSVAAAEVAALAAWRSAAAGDRIGAIVYSDSDQVELRPQARGGAVTRILHELVRFNTMLTGGAAASANPGRLNAALRRAAELASHDWLICLIGDAYGADADTVELATRLSEHNDVISVFVYDALEAELPNIGVAVVADAGRQLEVDTGSRNLRSRFAAGFAERRQRIAELSRERAIPVLDIRTDRDVAAQLREILGKGPLRAGRPHHGIALA